MLLSVSGVCGEHTGVFGVSQRSDVCVCVCGEHIGVFGVSQRSDVCVCVCADAGVFGVSEE